MKSEIKLLWPYAKIKLFGSTPLKLNLKNGDIDIVVFIPSSKEEDEFKYITELQETLEPKDWVNSC